MVLSIAGTFFLFSRSDGDRRRRRSCCQGAPVSRAGRGWIYALGGLFRPLFASIDQGRRRLTPSFFFLAVSLSCWALSRSPAKCATSAASTLERSACILGLIIVGGSPARSVASHVALVNYRRCPRRGRGPMGGGARPDFNVPLSFIAACGLDQLLAAPTGDQHHVDREPWPAMA